jgi:hypothetical protein
MSSGSANNTDRCFSQRGARERHDKEGKNEPLEWVAATGIYITNVVDIIERNSRILRCE